MNHAYPLYFGIKTHFARAKYDFFKYNGKGKWPDFNKRNDKYMFLKLDKKFPRKDDMIQFMASNFMFRDIHWIGDLLESEAVDVYNDSRRRIESFSYNFGNELDVLFSSSENPFKIPKDRDDPLILDMLWTGDISYETFIMLNEFGGFFRVYDEKLNDIYWPKLKFKCVKYKPFITYPDTGKLLDIFREKLYIYKSNTNNTINTNNTENMNDIQEV